MERVRQILRREQGGYVLLLTLIVTVFLFISLSGILSLSLVNLASAKRTVFDTNALYAAESGVDNAVYNLNQTSGSYTGTTSCPISGTSGAVQLYSDSVKGKATYQSCVTGGSISHEYYVYVTGKIYQNATAANPVSTRKLKVVVEGSPAGSYAVQTGPGGLIMRNSANVSQGPIYIGGYLTMSNQSSIGTSTLPIAVNVANYRCPAGGTGSYPQECTGNSNPNPITINGSQPHIYGPVNANEQLNSYPSNMTNTGLQNISGVSAPALPGYDRVAQVSAVSTTWTPAQANCSGNGKNAITAVTWPANLKITGDLTLTNSCTITISGNVWITGSFDMRNSSIIKVADSVATQPTIMVDGSNGVQTEQTSTVATNSTQVGMEFITFYSTNACSVGTNAGSYCDDLVAGGHNQDLYNSQSTTTINIGNQGDAAGSVFYSKYTKTTVGQAGTLGALLGQTIDLGQSGNLVFTSTVVTGNYSYDVKYYEIQ
jgi:hypothetical protein